MPGEPPDGNEARDRLNWRQVLALTVGGIIGADVYVASSFGAHLGPAALLLWAVGALMVVVIALTFARCAVAVPQNGGPYAYARLAFGPKIAFAVGWAVLLAQWASLAVLPVVFTRYLVALIPSLAPWWGGALVKTAFVATISWQNLHGTGVTRRVNDALTVAKLVPLVLLALAGAVYLGLHPREAASHLFPLRLPPWKEAGAALVPIFWAYAGFEVGTIAPDQVVDPRRTIPTAVMAGTLLSCGIYLAINLVVVGSVPGMQLASSPAPLATCASAVAAGLNLPIPRAAPAILGAGALISTLGTAGAVAFAASHLLAAMARTGLLPPSLGRPHPRYGTPSASVLLLGTTALAASLLGQLGTILGAAVFFLALSYLSTALAARRLALARGTARLLPWLAALASLYLLLHVGPEALVCGLALQSLGFVAHLIYRPRVAPPLSEWVRETAGLLLPPSRPATTPDRPQLATPGAHRSPYQGRFLPSVLSLRR